MVVVHGWAGLAIQASFLGVDRPDPLLAAQPRDLVLARGDALAGELVGDEPVPERRIGATLPGASWQRCRTHYAANLMSVTPKASWPWVKTLLHSVYNQPDQNSVHEQFDRVLDALPRSCPRSSTTSSKPAPTRSLRRSGDRSGRATRKNASTARTTRPHRPSSTWSASSRTEAP
jgi:hypothetical protein